MTRELTERRLLWTKNESENDTDFVHTFDVISPADSTQTVESMASQGDVSDTQGEDVRSVVSKTLRNQDFKQPPQEGADAESSNSSFDYKDLERFLPLEEEDDGNPVQIPVADMDHADGDEVIQAILRCVSAPTRK